MVDCRVRFLNDSLRRRAGAVVVLLIGLFSPAFAQIPLQGIERVATGEFHSCALSSGGAVQCWGENSAGQLGDGSTTPRPTAVGVVGLETGVTAIAVGAYHGCALLADGGRVLCWGDNHSGALGDGSKISRSVPVTVPGLSGVTAISTGADHSCALAGDGRIVCWGNNASGQLGSNRTESLVPAYVTGIDGGALAISASKSFTCAIAAGGRALCWGINGEGQLGDGSQTNRYLPVNVSSLGSGVLQLATGDNHSCALTSDRRVLCWGDNYGSQLTSSNPTGSTVPLRIPQLDASIASIAAGGRQSCAAGLDGVVRCWGANDRRSLYEIRKQPQVIAGLNASRALDAGSYHVCAVDGQGRVQCQGSDDHGQLGANSTVNRLTPLGPVAGLDSPVQAIAVSHLGPSIFVRDDKPQGATCALLEHGAVSCWGGNSIAQLGNDSSIESDRPGRLPGLEQGVKVIDASHYHQCALLSTGIVKCWGANGNGQLGDGTRTFRATPVTVIGLEPNVRAISVGTSHSCALLADGSVRCWGSNFAGELGNGSTLGSERPVTVDGLGNSAVAIATGEYSTCALLNSGIVSCWGANVGRGDLKPLRIVELGTTVKAISLSASQACALTTAGTVKCWGNQTYNPPDVPNLGTGVRAVAVGVYQTCAITADRKVRCWGYNFSGQLGNNSQDFSTTPVEVIGLSDVQAVDTGGAHSCAIVTGGAVRCWGSNVNGELGLGHHSFSNSGLATFAGTGNRSFLYWNPDQPGWGLTVQQQGNLLYGTWYTYADDGKPGFLTVEAKGPDNGSYVGPIYRVAGTPFDQINGRPALTSTSAVGAATLAFDRDGTLQFGYTVHGVAQTRSLRPFRFDAAAPSCLGSTASRSAARNMSDLWWNPLEAGWGLGLAHQGNAIALQWYTYGAAGRDQWISGLLTRQPDGSFSGDLQRPTAGTPLAQINGPATAFPVPAVGTATLRFSNGEIGNFRYTLDGVTQDKSIQRFVVVGTDQPRPLCID